DGIRDFSRDWSADVCSSDLSLVRLTGGSLAPTIKAHNVPLEIVNNVHIFLVRLTGGSSTRVLVAAAGDCEQVVYYTTWLRTVSAPLLRGVLILLEGDYSAWW